MKCPVCRDPDLNMTVREGIEIDYCPQCRGVWLDRGELDKIIDRSAQPAREEHFESSSHRPDHSDQYKYRKKRKSILDDLFDF
jgi:Zn-finger nucleic acid-binding protein